MVSLHESLRFLNLQPHPKNHVTPANRLLLSKLLSSRTFRRFTITEVVNKTWKMKGNIIIDKIENNVFKFLFYSQENRDLIFNGRPWSINRAHLILKHWPENKAITKFLLLLLPSRSTFMVSLLSLCMKTQRCKLGRLLERSILIQSLRRVSWDTYIYVLRLTLTLMVLSRQVSFKL